MESIGRLSACLGKIRSTTAAALLNQVSHRHPRKPDHHRRLIPTPAKHKTPADSISDGHGGTDTATVNLTVTPENDTPVAVVDTHSVAEDAGGNGDRCAGQ